MVEYLIVGAGFSGAVIAERIANILKKNVLIVEQRNHIGGNSFDEYNNDGILYHKYGPHWFHTNSDEIFNYLSNFTEWIEHKHIIKSSINGKLYDIPINRNTINKFFNLNLKTDEEVISFLASKREVITNPANSEEMVLSRVGEELYKIFFKGYTTKQWNCDPKKLLPSLTARIPIKYNEDDSYFNDKYQAMPKDGYSKLFEKLLENRKIKIELETDFFKIGHRIKYKYLIYTGMIDRFFDYKFGKLNYRSLTFEHKTLDKCNFQNYQQINYPGKEKYTRIIEWKHATHQKSENTSITYEFPTDFSENNEPFYPFPDHKNLLLASKYLEAASKLKNVFFIGRLAQYKYYNMDQVIASALNLFEKLKKI